MLLCTSRAVPYCHNKRPEDCQCCAGDLSLQRFSHCCRQLANIVTSWSLNPLRAMQVRVDSIQNLTLLTNLTHLSLFAMPYLGDLTELRLMPRLQTLMITCSIMRSLQRAASYVNLQNLNVRHQWATSWDLSCCTRLTDLSLDIPAHFQQLSLPHGQSVQLQKFSCARNKGHDSANRGNEDF